MSYLTIVQQMEFRGLQENLLIKVSEQLEENFPKLLKSLSRHVHKTSSTELLTGGDLKSRAEKSIARWKNQQLQLALKKAEVQLEKKLKHFSGQANQNASLMENASLYMPLVAGVGLVGASTAAIPVVISFGMTTASILAIWTSTVVSWPVIISGVAAILAGLTTGVITLGHVESHVQEHYRKKLHQEAERQVFAIGKKKGSSCVLIDIQNIVTQASQNKIKGYQS